MLTRYDTAPIVFSTYVEVIQVCSDLDLTDVSVLHVCGGDPSPFIAAV